MRLIYSAYIHGCPMLLFCLFMFINLQLCGKKFQSYGSMLRHRKLSHDPSTKKIKPENSRIKRKARKHSRFCDPKIARRYYNRVASDVAFNVKNCVHGNAEHIGNTQAYIQGDAKTDLTQVKSPSINKKTLALCNIKTKLAKSIPKMSPHKLGVSAPYIHTSIPEDGSEKKNGCEKTQLMCTSPDVYDRPGLWKYLCLVCLKYFPNTLELFTHQDVVHKFVNATYMEVGKNYDLPLHAMGAGKPVGCLPVTDGQSVICNPTKYTCTKCHQQFKTSAELHPHILNCGQKLLKPLTVEIPPIESKTAHPTPTTSKLLDRSRARQRQPARQQRAGHTQKKIMDMDGFKVRKTKRTRLDKEVVKQRRLEERLRKVTSLSPLSYEPSLEPTVSLNDLTQPQPQPPNQKPPSSKIENVTIYACPYCSISFKYKKAYQRHIDTKCEMMKRIVSPDHDTSANAETNTSKSNDQLLSGNSTLPQKVECKMSSTKEAEDSINRSEALFDEFFSPQRSVSQARVLAKFIHPARTCGPCFNCKKPNMARRYSHLQQRSENFVQFVMVRCKNISMQSCICKACELNFKNIYEKKKRRIERHSVVKKSPSSTRSVANESPTSLTLHPKTTASAINKKPFEKTHKSASQRFDCPSTSSISSRAARSLNRSANQLQNSSPKSTRNCIKTRRSTSMSAVRRKQSKPVQTKSLEQIFPEEMGDDDHSPSHQPSATHSAQKAELMSNVGKDNHFVPIESDIIDVEQEMSQPQVLQTQQQKPNNIIVWEEFTNEESTNAETVEAALALSENEGKQAHHSTDLLCNEKKTDSSSEGETRLQVILEFVKNAPLRVSGKVGRRSSLTDIIDAVTQRVKEDPSLAETLTKAINAAASDGSDSEELTRQTRYKAKRVAVRESASLPSVLDGLVDKVKVSAVNAALSNGHSDGKPAARSSIDLPAIDAKTTMPPPPQLVQMKKTSKPAANIKKLLDQKLHVPSSNQSVLISDKKELMEKKGSVQVEETITAAPLINIIAPQPCQQSAPESNLVSHANAVSGGVTVAAETARPLGQLWMPKPVKRRSADSLSNSSRSSHGPPKPKYVMTDSAHKHMVEIIDTVARGNVEPPSYQHLDEPGSPVASEASGSVLNGTSYNFMGSRDNLECIRTADYPCSVSTSSVGSGMSSSLGSILSTGANTSGHSNSGHSNSGHSNSGMAQPMKNLRLASIISKLSGSGHIGETKASLPAASPTISCPQNPNSIDSGFVSFTD